MDKLMWVLGQDAAGADVGIPRRQQEMPPGAGNRLFDQLLLAQYPQAAIPDEEAGEGSGPVSNGTGADFPGDGETLPGGKALPPGLAALAKGLEAMDGPLADPVRKTSVAQSLAGEIPSEASTIEGLGRKGKAGQGGRSVLQETDNGFQAARRQSGTEEKSPGENAEGLVSTGQELSAESLAAPGVQSSDRLDHPAPGQMDAARVRPALASEAREQGGSAEGEAVAGRSLNAGQSVAGETLDKRQGASARAQEARPGTQGAGTETKVMAAQKQASDLAPGASRLSLDDSRPGRPDAETVQPALASAAREQGGSAGAQETGSGTQGAGTETMVMAAQTQAYSPVPDASRKAPGRMDAATARPALAIATRGPGALAEGEATAGRSLDAAPSLELTSDALPEEASGFGGHGNTASAAEAVAHPDGQGAMKQGVDEPAADVGQAAPQGANWFVPVTERHDPGATVAAGQTMGASLAPSRGRRRMPDPPPSAELKNPAGRVDSDIEGKENVFRHQASLSGARLPVQSEALAAERDDATRMWQQTFQASLEAGRRMPENQASAAQSWGGLSLLSTQPGEVASAMVAQPRFETPLGQKNWGHELGQRMLFMVDQKQQSAEIRLNPQHLGNIEIRLNMNHDQASVSIHVQHAAVREAVENALPRLREMFDQAGLNLAQFSASDQQQGKQDQPSWTDPGDGGSGLPGGRAGDGDQAASVTRSSAQRLTSLLDTYA